MNVSYLVTCHNETTCLNNLLSLLINKKTDNHEVVVVDDYSDNPDTVSILNKHKEKIEYYQHKLDANYGAHKNYGIDQCKGKWIFQIDADEYPTDGLIENIDAILEANDHNEVIWIPRLNYFEGVTQNDIQMWGWRYHEGMINFPDYQSRLYRNLPKIRYQRRLHEKVEGFKSFSFIPPQKDYALVHKKTIEKQRETNNRYNKVFTEEENKGYNVRS